jgi:hypothetical protein
MAESPRRLELRLTISGAAPYRGVAVELAMKFAQYAGASQRSVPKGPTALLQMTPGRAGT